MTSESNPTLFARINQLLASQLAGVLATQQTQASDAALRPEQPYTSLMAFAHTPDLRFLLIATLRDTQKHLNLLQNGAISMLIDNRGNTAIDYQQATAISAIGCAEIIPEPDYAQLFALFAAKHPQLVEFMSQPNCTLMRIAIDCYRVVSEFQATSVLRPTALGQR